MSEREQIPKIPLPEAGDAARKARLEGDAINQAYGIPTVPRDQYRAAAYVRLRGRGGIPWGPVQEPKPGLSTRTAADYLPPQLKARLIAEGRLAADGKPIAIPPAQIAAPERGTAGIQFIREQAAAPGGALARLGRLFRKYFSSRNSKQKDSGE